MQQLLATAQQIMNVLNSTNVAVAKVEEKTTVIKENLSNFRQLERLAIRWLAISRRLGLPDNVSDAAQKIASLVIMVRMLQISFAQLSSGPVGVLIGIAGLIGVTLSAVDLMRGGS